MPLSQLNADKVPALPAAKPVVTDPMKGSSTVAPGSENEVISGVRISIAFCASNLP